MADGQLLFVNQSEVSPRLVAALRLFANLLTKNLPIHKCCFVWSSDWGNWLILRLLAFSQ